MGKNLLARQKETNKAYFDAGLADSFYQRYKFAPEYNYKTGRWGK